MGIKLMIGIESPLTDEDRDLLTGVSIMVLAIANRPLAESKFPEVYPTEVPVEEPESEPPAEPGPLKN